MERASAKISRALVIFIGLVIFVKYLSGTGLFEPKNHRGHGYSVSIPQGWKKVKKQKGVVYPKGVEVVLFVPKGTDVKTEEPDTYISVFTKKLETPAWIEDEFPGILESIKREGNRVMDKGEIKLDDVISQWVVYYSQKHDALFLEFYIVTDANVFYKMQYSAPSEVFNKLRPSFEELKESFKFRFSLS